MNEAKEKGGHSAARPGIGQAVYGLTVPGYQLFRLNMVHVIRLPHFSF